ncbi:MAG: ABC transporter substrate-binding protein [Gammaproteobacteria bacterium]|nr:MAG: ABC transporter substrate-binding protein [Gammaproteobacteria bacterium]PHR84136.1 MAG: ABC transporter substrate-binding protein [Colwellia sp.]
MNILSKLVLGIVFFGGMVGSSFAADVTLRYNQWFPSQHWSQKEGLYKYFEEIEKVTEGRVKVRPSAKPLAPPTKNYQAVLSGIADIAWGPHGYTPGAFLLTEMVEFPFLTYDAGVSSRAYWRTYKQFFEPTGMQKGVVTLAMHVTSGGNIHMRTEAILKPEDFSGQKMRVQTSVMGGALKSLGAVPISGSLPELREFLSRGVIDGTMLSDELLYGFKVHKYIKKVTRIPGGIFTNSAFVIMNKKKWAIISEKDRLAIMEISGEKLSERMGRLWHENDIEAREKLKKSLGGDYQVASKSLIKAIDKSFEEGRKSWFEKAKEEGIDGQQALDYYQEQVKNLGPQS